jgi:ABC-type multidrug transport system fused ATPase/permease subunit
MDGPTAELFDQAVHELAERRTMLILPSRLSTLRRVDRILLLHEGKLVDEGTHSELLHRSDLYRHLIYLRFNAFRDGRAAVVTTASPRQMVS